MESEADELKGLLTMPVSYNFRTCLQVFTTPTFTVYT